MRINLFIIINITNTFYHVVLLWKKWILDQTSDIKFSIQSVFLWTFRYKIKLEYELISFLDHRKGNSFPIPGKHLSKI